MEFFNKMEGANSYVRASLLSMSQSMGSPLHDPLRHIHPALHSVAVSEANKDAGGLLRPLSDYHHLPLLPFSPSHFLPHSLDPRLPFSPSAFHPLHSKPPNGGVVSLTSSPAITSTVSGLHSSAFSPLPSKTTKLEADSSIPSSGAQNIFSHNMIQASLVDQARNAFLGGLSPPGINVPSSGASGEDRRDSPSPRESHGSRDSPAVHGRDADTPNSTDDSRARRVKPGEVWCPVCCSPIPGSDYEVHLNQELNMLAQILSTRGHRDPPHSPSSGGSLMHPGGSLSPLEGGRLRNRDPGFDTYDRIRNNRQNRLRFKKRRCGRMEEVPCPICGERFTVVDEVMSHLEHCIRRAQFVCLQSKSHNSGGAGGGLHGGADEELVDVEGDGTTEASDWSTASRLEGRGAVRPLKSLNDCISEKCSPSSNGEKEPLGETEPHSPPQNGVKRPREEASSSSDPPGSEVEELKEKIRILEKNNNSVIENANKSYSCLVCRSDYKRPTVSVVCWHVMCEGCWSNTLGVKTECPQCSQTMASEDLRPIHL